MNKSLKYFFILGAAKCGTSSLYYYLNQHPDILMSTPKEPLFFEKEYNNGLDYYKKKYFSLHTNERLLGEARHRNLFLPYIPPRIAKSFPDSKFIIILRNPVDRAFSHYIHRKNRGMDSLSFEDAIKENLARVSEGITFSNNDQIESYINQLSDDGASLQFRTYIDCGYYAQQINRYLKYFSLENFLIIFMEDLSANAKKTYHDILQFLDINLALNDINFKKQNVRATKLNIQISNALNRHPLLKSLIPQKLKQIIRDLINKNFSNQYKINEETRSLLISHYLEHNNALEHLIGRDLSHWNI